MAIPIVIKAIRKGGGSGVCEYNTQAYWNAQTTYIPAAGTIIIYSDIDKMKIADGVLQFLDFLGGKRNIQIQKLRICGKILKRRVKQ